jgi:hypothetical protein
MERTVGSVSRRLFGSASSILVTVLLVMATGMFILLGLQFHASWQDLIHSNRVLQLAAADRVIYEAAETVRVGRGQVQSVLLAQDDPQAAMAAMFAKSEAQIERVLQEIPPDLAEHTATRLAELRSQWSAATGLRSGLLAIAAKGEMPLTPLSALPVSLAEPNGSSNARGSLQQS